MRVRAREHVGRDSIPTTALHETRLAIALRCHLGTGARQSGGGKERFEHHFLAKFRGVSARFAGLRVRLLSFVRKLLSFVPELKLQLTNDIEGFVSARGHDVMTSLRRRLPSPANSKRVERRSEVRKQWKRTEERFPERIREHKQELS